MTQKDKPPSIGYPTSLWDAGEVIKDEFVLDVPAQSGSGSYWFAVGLYNASNGERLFVPDSPDNQILLGPFSETDLHRLTPDQVVDHE